MFFSPFFLHEAAALFIVSPKDHWTLKTGYFEDPTPSIQVQTLPLEGPRSLGEAPLFIVRGVLYILQKNDFQGLGD